MINRVTDILENTKNWFIDICKCAIVERNDLKTKKQFIREHEEMAN